MASLDQQKGLPRDATEERGPTAAVGVRQEQPAWRDLPACGSASGLHSSQSMQREFSASSRAQDGLRRESRRGWTRWVHQRTTLQSAMHDVSLRRCAAPGIDATAQRGENQTAPDTCENEGAGLAARGTFRSPQQGPERGDGQTANSRDVRSRCAIGGVNDHRLGDGAACAPTDPRWT